MMCWATLIEVQSLVHHWIWCFWCVLWLFVGQLPLLNLGHISFLVFFHLGNWMVKYIAFLTSCMRIPYSLYMCILCVFGPWKLIKQDYGKVICATRKISPPLPMPQIFCCFIRLLYLRFSSYTTRAEMVGFNYFFLLAADLLLNCQYVPLKINIQQSKPFHADHHLKSSVLSFGWIGEIRI